MKTTLYNHNNTEKDGKPLIPNVIYRGLLILIRVKDYEAAKYIVSNYSLTEFQNTLYEYALNNGLRC